MALSGFIDTNHGNIAYVQSREDGPPILMIHGNSSCKDAFAGQLAAPELGRYRIVAIDLPGHGASDDAPRAEIDYTFEGYADMAGEVMRSLGLTMPVLFGWSLGGHVALEMVGRGYAVSGCMISGTPPIAPVIESLMAGFNIDPAAENLTGKRDFTDADVVAYATHTSAVDGVVDPHLLAMVRRTDGRAREIMFGSVVAGMPLDERNIVETTQVPMAVVNGAGDPFIRADYFDSLKWSTLWARGVVRLDGAGHAPFLQRPAEFNALLKLFADSVEARTEDGLASR
jgi:pimeloyl-ACP methyl ester carboxylesterase